MGDTKSGSREKNTMIELTTSNGKVYYPKNITSRFMIQTLINKDRVENLEKFEEIAEKYGIEVSYANIQTIC